MADMPGLRFRVEERTPAHTTFRVFVGEEGQGSSAGLLTFRNEEYDQLAPLLLAAGDMLAAVTAFLAVVDESEGVTGWHLNDAIAPWSEFEFINDMREAAARGGAA